MAASGSSSDPRDAPGRAGASRPAGSPSAAAGPAVLLAAVATAVVLAWGGREATARWWSERPSAAAARPAGADAAGSVRRRLEAFASGRGPRELRLDGEEVDALVRAYVVPRLPPGVSRPRLSLDDSTVVASAVVEVGRVLGDGAPAVLRRALGDSARMSVRVRPSAPRPGVVRLRVQEVRAGTLQVPPALLPWALRETDLTAPPDDPSAVELQGPPGLAGLRVEDGWLVLTRRP